MRKNHIWLMVFILLISLVYAVPPQYNPTTVIPSITVVVPELNCIPKSNDVKLSFDILNSTYARLDNNTTECSFASINKYGEINAQGYLNYNSTLGFWQFQLYSQNITHTNRHNYYVHCNSSTEAGYASDIYTVTSTGSCTEVTGQPLAVMILIPLIIGLFFIIGAVTLNDEEHNALRIGLFLFALFSIFGSFYIAVQIIVKYYNFPALQNDLTWIMYGFAGLLSVIVFYFLVYIITVAIHTAGEKRDERLKY